MRFLLALSLIFWASATLAMEAIAFKPDDKDYKGIHHSLRETAAIQRFHNIRGWGVDTVDDLFYICGEADVSEQPERLLFYGILLRVSDDLRVFEPMLLSGASEQERAAVIGRCEDEMRFVPDAQP